MGSIIYWIAIGLVAGILGKMIMPGRDPGGIIVTILLGIAGAVVGGFLSSTFLGIATGGFNLTTIIVATLGAVLLLWLYRMFRARRA
ncbi:MAG: GlsB/YeaQ/YmgE family stress response membrane protein [Pseudomonadota bacterium]